jgi:3-oxoacyl-[acyl-carrier protein] reductase
MMARDLYGDVMQQYLDAGGGEPNRWWDTERIPLDSIDKSVSELLSLRGKKAVVTGGAGLNLGQACVNRLAGLGADVAVVDLPREVAEAAGYQRWSTPADAPSIAAAAAEKWGVKTVAVHGDAMDWDGIQGILRECDEALGGIDILVNNACDVVVGDFVTMTKADIDRSVRGTLSGMMYSARLAMDYMIPRGGGVIINVGSEAGGTAFPDIELYGALKAGLSAFTRYVGKSAARHNIRMVGVNAGSMWHPNRPAPPETRASLLPLGRTGIQRYELPEEVANMIAFLASDAASSMVGNMIDMGGGMSI